MKSPANQAYPRFVGTVAVLLLFLVSAHGLAQTLQPLRFEESLNPEVKVAGATRGGVLIDARQRPESLETLTVRVPPGNESSQLCLTLVTRDGRYEGNMEFAIPPGTENFVELTYPTQFRKQLLEANEPYLAVLAGLQSDCDSDDTRYVPTAWKRPEKFSTIQLVVNAGNLHAHVAVPTVDGGERRFECERVATSPTIAFNLICTIELAPDLDLMGTEIRRDDFFGNPVPPVAVPIAF